MHIFASHFKSRSQKKLAVQQQHDHPVSELSPARRAVQGAGKGQAWDLMMETAKLPTYHPVNTPHGLIDLSGAHSGLMKDYLADFMREAQEDMDLVESKLSCLFLLDLA